MRNDIKKDKIFRGRDKDWMIGLTDVKALWVGVRVMRSEDEVVVTRVICAWSIFHGEVCA